MSATTRRSRFVVSLLVAWAGLPAQSASAYTLVDWMRMWPNQLPAAVAAAPAYPGAAPAYVPPTVVTPSVPYVAPPPTASPGCGTPVPPACGTPLPAAAAPATPLGSSWNPTLPQVAVSYVPEVRYRTTWMRVPTTNYRPISSVTTGDGCPTTCMMPCTTYSWQLRRIPYTTYRAVYTTVPATAVVPGGCSPCTPTTVAPAAPYYTPAPAANPIGTAVPGASPTPAWSTAPSLQRSPASPAAPAYSTPPGSPTPADRPPSLSPGEAQNLRRPVNGATTNDPPSSSAVVPVPAPTVPVPSSTIPLPPPPSRLNGKPGSKSNTGPDIVPLPDPEAEKNRKPTPAAPALFDARDRTAQRLLPFAGEAAPIVWPDVPPASREPATTLPRVDPTSPTSRVDTSGWHSVSP